MKHFILIMTAAVVGAAAMAATTTEINWTSQLGQLVQNTDGVRSMMEQVGAPNQQEFAARLLRAANTLPLTPEAKNERIARIAHELVAGAKTGEEKIATLSTIFVKTAPKYLSGVSDTLSVGLEIGRNGLSQADFLNIATNVISDVERRTAGDPDQLLRVTMTIATFLRAAGTALDLEPALLAALSDSGLAELVQPVLGPATKKDYDPMLKANAAEGSGGSNAFVAFSTVAAPGEPLFHIGAIPTVGVGGWRSGIGGSSFKGVDARPVEPPSPYRGQVITPPGGGGKPGW